MAGGFCTLCSHHVDSFDGLNACPKCGHKGVPCGDENQVTVSVNVHELRLLCIWAENYAQSISKAGDTYNEVVYAIACRLRRQLPNGNCLTMSDEFKALAEHFHFETNHPADEGNHPFEDSTNDHG